ncbi:UNVERIFIED_CONTAM: Retrovirus-related Pol polyprotein from transposon [Sesamum radiatum]|uniref:Retrovirus-related Pol polyprotein from transposon n=1 Tax=Sesamum radiatum TaxID=300843 RepID=A0AAW2NSP0_SESRA
MLHKYPEELTREARGKTPLDKKEKRMVGPQYEARDISKAPLRKFEERRVEAVEELKVVNLVCEGEIEEKMTKIDTRMSPPVEGYLIEFLKENEEVFAWNMTDLRGISPDIITHRLNVNPDAKPPNEKWRLCIDFTDLNKGCPKDPFPLPRINMLVNSTSGYEMLSFLDAYQEYNQIPLVPEDQEKASFVTNQGVFCYNVMPFGLKKLQGLHTNNLSITFFLDQIGRNMQVYIYDMLVKSIKEQDHIKDLQECFQILKSFGLKLNPAKCTFGVLGGKFLGYMMSERGIESNPEKIRAIMDMLPPHSIKDV